MPASGTPADEATLLAFAGLLRAVLDWRKTIDLQIDGKTIFRVTVNFRGPMAPESWPQLEIVDGFPDEPAEAAGFGNPPDDGPGAAAIARPGLAPPPQKPDALAFGPQSDRTGSGVSASGAILAGVALPASPGLGLFGAAKGIASAEIGADLAGGIIGALLSPEAIGAAAIAASAVFLKEDLTIRGAGEGEDALVLRQHERFLLDEAALVPTLIPSAPAMVVAQDETPGPGTARGIGDNSGNTTPLDEPDPPPPPVGPPAAVVAAATATAVATHPEMGDEISRELEALPGQIDRIEQTLEQAGTYPSPSNAPNNVAGALGQTADEFLA